MYARLRTLAAAATLGGLLGAAALAGTPAAAAPTDHIQPGDILIASFGDLITSAGVDKMNPVTKQVSDAASLGINDATSLVAAAPNGDFFAANLEGDITRVDHVTGEQTRIRKGFSPSVEFNDLVVGPDGDLIAVLNEATGPSVIRIEAATGRLIKVLAEDGPIDRASSIAVEHDGSVLVTDFDEILRIAPSGGQVSVVTRFPAPNLAKGVVVRSDGTILVRTNGDGVSPKLVAVDPVTGAKTTISVGNFFSKGTGSQGLSIENGSTVLSAETGADTAPSCGSTPSPGNSKNCSAATATTSTTSRWQPARFRRRPSRSPSMTRSP
jgi:outer membrane protein assembly factor BamB